MKRWLVVGAALAAGAALVIFTLPLFAAWRLEDFANTFYRVGENLWRDKNVYTSAYPHPTNGRDYPPYAPLWIWYALMPFAALPLPLAQAIRFWLDVFALPLMAYLAARWARLAETRWLIVLVLAPWLLTELSTGQITPLVFIGILLCYWGVRQPSAALTAIGLWLALTKFTLVALVILATLIFAWRAKIFWRALAILFVLIAVASLPSPWWWRDLFQLYLRRLGAPNLADSVLLLPGYPWAQLSLLGVGAILLIAYVARVKPTQPTVELWAILVTASLVGALHTFVYDWQLLMLPLAVLLRYRWGVLLTVAVYAYAFVWAIVAVGLEIPFPSPAIIPGVVLCALMAMVFVEQTRWNGNRQ